MPYRAITDAYNAACPRLPRANAPSATRRKAMHARWMESPERRDLAWWRAYFERAGRSDFLAGRNDRNWRAGLDWLLRTGNAEKVLEGRYDPRPAAGGAASPPLRSPTEILMAAGLGPLRGDPDCVDAEVVGSD